MGGVIKLRMLYNAGLWFLLSGSAAMATSISQNALMRMVRSVSSLLTDEVAPTACVAGLSMVGIDMLRNRSLHEFSGTGMSVLAAGGLGVGAGQFMTYYGVTGALI